MKKTEWWNVYLNGKWIDSVSFVQGGTREEVKKSLVEHDGYNPNITVKSRGETKNEN